jgi:hypothetical protein
MATMDARVSEPRLSKSRYLHGLQCAKQLWWRVKEPQALELIPDLETRARFEEGHRVGARARRHVPGGVMITGPYDDLEARVVATRDALVAGAQVVYEASFFADSTYVAVDILERLERGFGMIEVKASTARRPEHLQDAAVQAHVLRASGLDLRRVELMRLDPECAFPHLERLFLREDVTGEVDELLPEMPAALAGQLRMLGGPRPEVAIGSHCSSPHSCPFKRRCWGGLPRHHVTTLYRAGAKAFELSAAGLHTLPDLRTLPEGVELHPAALRQIRAVSEARLVVEPGLGAALEAFEGPLAYLDFETVGPAIPVWSGCHPFEAVPVQFSCRKEADGGVATADWIAAEGQDPRRELAERVLEACRGAKTVVAYNADFEATALAHLEGALPSLADSLAELRSRLRDPLSVLREHVYHPDFGGGFGLKAVAPALAPDLRPMTGQIPGGRMASVLLYRLLIEGRPDDFFEREQVRQSLHRYCAMDTLATQRVLERLRELARSS